MHVIDLSPEHEKLYFDCLEDWSEEIREAGDHRARWYHRMKDRGLRVKLALNDDGVVGGMIQYLPIEESTVEGRGLYFIPCIWVHGHKQGRGNQQGRGLGSALLAAAERDAAERGAKGMAAWGLMLPFWMKASWFRRHGYRKAGRDGIARLVWKPFTSDAEPPRWMRQKKQPETTPGRVTVTALCSGWCTGLNLAFERAKRAAADLGPCVAFRAVDTSDRPTLEEWGLSDALFVDGKRIASGPPPSYDTLRKAVVRRVRALG